MMKGLIFDLDGVLISTVKYHYMAWKKLSDELHLKFDMQDNELLKGVSRTRSFSIILELNNKEMSEEEIEYYCAKKNSYYLEYIAGISEKDLLPGAKDFLIEARERGYKIALGSASKNARQILTQSGILEYFDVIIDGNLVSNAKPNPEVFAKGAEQMGFDYKNCLVFEDSIAGIVASHAINMKAVGVGNNEVKNISDYFIEGFNKTKLDVILKKI